MSLRNKTKIVCTIGPASESPENLERMILAGMNVARLNFSHGDFSTHEQVIRNIREASRKVGRRVAIMADLPGPKIRIGQLKHEPLDLTIGDSLLLTTNAQHHDEHAVYVPLERLPHAVKVGDTLFLNDGMIQLTVTMVDGLDIICEVVVGGELRSRKGLNLPGIDLGISAFTRRDKECLLFALENGVDAVSQSFVAKPEDVIAVREAASGSGHDVFVLAKIERAGALDHLDEILEVSDGVMIARGDLGVEIPIERIARVQKDITRRANLLGKPVITATQMLASMVNQRRPTRAEATDVANAILDGTDCVMLSEESAMGQYPVDAVQMLSAIAASTEPELDNRAATMHEVIEDHSRQHGPKVVDVITTNVDNALRAIAAVGVLVPTNSGNTARNVARFRLPVWINAFSEHEKTCQRLLFTYGVWPEHVDEELRDWSKFAIDWLHTQGLTDGLVILTQGPSSRYPDVDHRMEILDLSRHRDE